MSHLKFFLEQGLNTEWRFYFQKTQLKERTLYLFRKPTELEVGQECFDRGRADSGILFFVFFILLFSPPFFLFR